MGNNSSTRVVKLADHNTLKNRKIARSSWSCKAEVR